MRNLIKTASIFLALISLQACSTFRTCATVLDNEDYYSSPHFKSVAMVFDDETQRPPKNLGPIENECWYDYEANSQEEADVIVLDGCRANLQNIGKADEWSCVLIAQGDELTDAEQQRIDDWKRLSGRTKKEDSRMTTSPPGPGYDPDR